MKGFGALQVCLVDRGMQIPFCVLEVSYDEYDREYICAFVPLRSYLQSNMDG